MPICAGRTLDNAFIILDEAQNTTPAQMKMFLTRIGFGSKVIITGDASQKDLPRDATSGLDVAMKVLKKIDDIGFCQLTSKDVVAPSRWFSRSYRHMMHMRKNRNRKDPPEAETEGTTDDHADRL